MMDRVKKIMVNSDRESLEMEGHPEGGRSRKVRGENVKEFKTTKRDAKNKCDNANQESWKEEVFFFFLVCGMKCPMKDVEVVLDGFLQSLLAVHMLLSLPEAGK